MACVASAWSEGAFSLREIVRRTGALLLLDASNLYANALNHGHDEHAFLDALPLIASRTCTPLEGRRARASVTTRMPTRLTTARSARSLAAPARTGPRPALLERDDGLDTREALDAELDRVGTVLAGARIPRGALASDRRLVLREAQDAVVRALLDGAVLPRGLTRSRSCAPET